MKNNDDYGFDNEEEVDDMYGLDVDQYTALFFDDDGNGLKNEVLVPIPASEKDLFFKSWERGLPSLDTIAREIQEQKARKNEIAKPPSGNWLRVLEGGNVRYIRDSDVNLGKAGTILGKWNGGEE
jgi:hypothetical protein